MNQVTERKRLRQEYLKQKRTAYSKHIVVTVGTLAFIGIVTLLIYHGHAVDIGMQLWLVIYTIVLVYGHSHTAYKEAKSIPVVPPVTADTLPAEEILVRASEEPSVAQSEVLLRAVQRGQEAPKEELLRVSQGE